MPNINKFQTEFPHPRLNSIYVCVDGTKGLVELLASLAASIKHLDRSNSNTENTSEEFRKDLKN